MRMMMTLTTLSVEQARRLNVCRICLGPAAPGTEPGNSFLLDYGYEHAHLDCVVKFELGVHGEKYAGDKYSDCPLEIRKRLHELEMAKSKEPAVRYMTEAEIRAERERGQ